jgi:D-glycero-D-manno-heptose 1,7-bisphosphate phosphatase
MHSRAAHREGIELGKSFMIGDRWNDVEAGRRAHCRTILIGDGYGELQMSQPDVVVPGLRQAAEWILKFTDRTRSKG